MQRDQRDDATDRKMTKAGSDADFGAARYRAVQIVHPCSDGSFKMDSNELERVFGQVADVPVAVYSLTGAFRKGKSFMLNLFLRYLLFQKAGESRNWLANHEEHIREGFSWRGGRERITQGAWLWDEPFFFKTPRGEVALFLMDTQGSFDSSTSVKGSSIIFALSTMISSVQIYNVMQQIQEDSLQYLQLFTDYGKAAFKTRKLEGKPFQNLLFLVRDWSDLDVPFGIKGGHQVLDHLLTVTRKHRDLESVRENLTNSYEDVSCFLMPYPGRKVAARGIHNGSSLHLKNMDPEFLDHLEELVQHLFSPQTIVIKRFNGNIVSGRDLITFMLAYFEVFRSGSMPKVGTILQASAQAGMITVMEQCKEILSTKMSQVFKQVDYYQGSTLNELHESIRHLVLGEYDRLPKLGDDSFISENRRNLIDLINQKFAAHQQTNIAQMEKLKNRVRNVAAEAEVRYSTSFEHQCKDNWLEDHDFERVHETLRKDALEIFDSSDVGRGTVHRIEERKRLLNKICEIRTKITHINEINKKLAQAAESNKEKVKPVYNRRMQNPHARPDESNDQLSEQLQNLQIRDQNGGFAAQGDKANFSGSYIAAGDMYFGNSQPK